jgi:uncharacterized protein YegP (UPF0339 family)
MKMYYKLYQDGQQQWRWHLKAANHKILADSAEGYWNRADAEEGIKLVKSAFSAPIYT